MSQIDPYTSSQPSTDKYLQLKSPIRPIRINLADTHHKILAWILDASLLGALFWGAQLHWALWLVTSIAYFTLLEISPLQASIGEYLAGIHVIHRSGRPIKLKHALTRSLAYLLTGGLSSVSSSFSKKGCSLQDKISHTLSVCETYSKEKD